MQISPRETLTLAMQSVWAHRFRSALTILGIVIGITTVVTVASLLSGVRKGVVSFFEEFGPDNVFIARVSGDPSGDGTSIKERRRRPLRPEYADYLKRTVRTIEDVSINLFINPRGRVLTAKVQGFESDNMSLTALTANDFELAPRDVKEGRLFNEQEQIRGQRVAVIGSNLANALFPAGGAVNQPVLIDGAEYIIVGVLAPAKGGFFGENGKDNEVTIPLDTAESRYPQADNYLMTAKARPGLRADAIDEIRDAMRKIRKLQPGVEDDFNISTADSIIQNFDKITGMIVLISIAISGLGLLVGGIGVMNIMLVSVTERTKEIGVRKAIGARRADIILQFLSEAVALTGLGGIVGILLSVLVSLVLGALSPTMAGGVPIWAVVTGFSVSVFIGVFFGVWPAMKASKLDPVEALRYE